MGKRIKPKNKPHRKHKQTASTKKPVECPHCGKQRAFLEMCCLKSLFV